MSASRSAALVTGAAWLAIPHAARAAGGERADLLAAEAARIASGLGAAAAPISPWAVALFCLGTLAAAFCGSYFGLWRPAFGRVRDEDGWREVTYRFKSSSPLKISDHMLHRMTGVIGDLEDLGVRIRKMTAVPTAATPLPTPKARRQMARSEPPSPPADPPKEVEFLRRTVEEPEPEPAPEQMSVTVPPIEPEDRGGGPPERDGHRATVQRARRLLEEGHDAQTVREITGLKLAELDLIQWSPASDRQGVA